MIDRYTKIVLTVIAVALTAIAAERVVAPAQAQVETVACGATAETACFVKTGPIEILKTTVAY